MSRGFANPLTELAEFEQLQESLKKKKGPVQVSGCLDSQKVHLMQETMTDRPWKLVVTYDDARAREIYDDFGCFRDNVWLYPAKDLLFYSADIHGNLLTRERLQVLRHLMEDQNGVVVTTMDGLMDHLLPLRCMQEQVLHLETGQELDLEAWKLRLAELGYERMPQVDGMGQFSVRGGILDIYPLTEELPVRIELWDTEVDSIRTFDLESQRSVEQLDEVTIYPAHTTAEEILSTNPDGIMLSNGPGDPKECTDIIKEIRKLYESDTPIFAICLGHQLMALATGADTHKMKYGHRGGNHPVKDLQTGRVYISSQNHGYVVDTDKLDPSVAVPAFVNVNDGTNEGLSYTGKNIFTVQFHPEACPGPLDSGYLFDRFMKMMEVSE